MNDYTLSPVFNIRGKKVINENTIYSYLPKIGDDINYGDDYLIEGTDENVKGVFKIDMTDKSMMNGTLSIKPIVNSYVLVVCIDTMLPTFSKLIDSSFSTSTRTWLVSTYTTCPIKSSLVNCILFIKIQHLQPLHVALVF